MHLERRIEHLPTPFLHTPHGHLPELFPCSVQILHLIIFVFSRFTLEAPPSLMSFSSPLYLPSYWVIKTHLIFAAGNEGKFFFLNEFFQNIEVSMAQKPLQIVEI